MNQVMVLLGLAAICLVVPARVHAQAAWASVEASPSRLTNPAQPTRQAVSIPDSVRKKVGYQHWRGATIGAAAGAVGGVALALLAHGSCDDCPSNDPDVPEAGVLGAGLGAAFGFLVGAASPRYRWVPNEAEHAREGPD